MPAREGMSPEEHAAYMRAYRRTPEGRAYLIAQKQRAKARHRALVRLSQMHHHDYLALFNEELRKMRLEGQ